MARARSDTGTFAKEPHSVSLKGMRALVDALLHSIVADVSSPQVLLYRSNELHLLINGRLSRPSLALQHPLPRQSDSKIPHIASLAYPCESSDPDFIISSNLSLPPAFGSAHVGETFSCALCANNELPDGTVSRTASGVKILAEMQTPSHSVPLELQSAESADEKEQTTSPATGCSLQKMIKFDLKEEGNHVLAVNVSYTETLQGDGQAPSGRVRSFRKLYQFLAQPCLSVRTKATELPPIEVSDHSVSGPDRGSLVRYALEAQLENVSDTAIVLTEARLQPRPPFKSTSLTGTDEGMTGGQAPSPFLNPRDVMQVAFLVEQQPGVSEGLEDLQSSLRREGRAILGQLTIQWRSGMGEKGSLSTGNLLTRRRMP